MLIAFAPEETMPYTLWSRGILVGATDFALGEQDSRHLAGVFQPAESGMMLLPAITAMAPALFELKTMMKREHVSEEDADNDPDRVLAIFEQSPEGQRIIASAKEIEQLELRAPNGRVIEIESILVSDLTELSRIGMSTRRLKRGKKGKKRGKHRNDPIRYLISATIAPPPGVMLA
jgi:hypothetical protein